MSGSRSPGTSSDDARLLPRLRGERDGAAAVERAVREAAEPSPDLPPGAGGDPLQLRGIPVVPVRRLGDRPSSSPPSPWRAARTCPVCGKPKRSSRRRCRCKRPKGIPPSAIAPREPEPLEAPTAVEALPLPEPEQEPVEAEPPAEEPEPDTRLRVCLDCGAEFAPRSTNQTRCGSVKEHRGCAWAHRQAWQRTDAARRRLGLEREEVEREEVLPAPELELDPGDECAEAARRLLERHDLAVDALWTNGGPDEGYALLERVCWPPEDDPDYALIEAARPAWTARYAAAASQHRAGVGTTAVS